jgi:hypothetical protein
VAVGRTRRGVPTTRPTVSILTSVRKMALKDRAAVASRPQRLRGGGVFCEAAQSRASGCRGSHDRLRRPVASGRVIALAPSDSSAVPAARDCYATRTHSSARAVSHDPFRMIEASAQRSATAGRPARPQLRTSGLFAGGSASAMRTCHRAPEGRRFGWRGELERSLPASASPGRACSARPEQAGLSAR